MIQPHGIDTIQLSFCHYDKLSLFLVSFTFFKMLDFSSSLFPGAQFHLRGGHGYHQLCHGHCHPEVRIVQKIKHFRTYQVSGAQRKKDEGENN